MDPFRTARLKSLLKRNILILDGAMGTMIQARDLTEADFRGERFAHHPVDVKGNNDLLCLTRPDVIREIHDAYLAAGADILETCTFNSNAPSQGDYRLVGLTRELNREAARIARAACDHFEAQTPAKPRFVAGILGPTNRTASISPDVADPGMRNITFDQLAEDYLEAVEGLVEGGADVLMVETIFDPLNAKAALYAILEFKARTGVEVPVMISVTLTDRGGRTLTGQTVEGFVYAVSHVQPLAIGFNCALGAEHLRPHVQELSRLTAAYVSLHPNAGLPNPFGGYDETPESFAAAMAHMAEEGLLNIAGGCCGTTPDHIRALELALREIPPRTPRDIPTACRLSGLEPLVIDDRSLFVNVGERTNVAGSRKFARLILSGDYAAAVDIAREQVENGAQVIDINMDEGMLDAKTAMTTFLNLLAGEPAVARVPVMIDSSRWEVIEAGLKCLQGRGIVNSISLKEGEEPFLRQAGRIRQLGAAVIVMAFDEQGQADTLERRKTICRRAYELLTQQAGFSPEEIIFDPNVFAVATGMVEHSHYAVDFIEATRWIKQNLPHALVSGGVSNVSFSFRGNDRVREAMHSVFLYHAIKAGMSMGIVNPGQLAIYEEIDPELRDRVEDVVLDRHPDGVERLLEIAGAFREAGGTAADAAAEPAWRQEPAPARLRHAMVQGLDAWVEQDVEACRLLLGTPLQVIEGPLMEGMEIVGELFGSGKMFLPQVVKSARVMKRAVAYLAPFFEAGQEGASSKGRILLATVKGDVHDIGKNIVKVVLQCNGFEVEDLGVMVPTEAIVERAMAWPADLIGLSGLITPSLEQMTLVAQEMKRRGLQQPLLIGGATTSPAHTAVKIAPLRDGPVVHVKDASRAVGVASDLLHPQRRESFAAKTRADQQRLRDQQIAGRERPLISLEAARTNAFHPDWSAAPPPRPRQPGVVVLRDYPLAELAAYIDWTPFFHAWELPGKYPAILQDPLRGQEADKLLREAHQWLDRIQREGLLHAHGVFGLFPANQVEEDRIALFTDETRQTRLATLPTPRQRQIKPPGKPHYALCDFIAPVGVPDWMGLFAVSAGFGLEESAARVERNHDDFASILLKALADRLAEAFAERLHQRVRQEFWGYAPDESLSHDELIQEKYQGIRPAPGYPSCPDHVLKQEIWRLLGVEESIGMKLTESFAMLPAASVSGFYFSHPAARYFHV
ncbi:MAG: methionine synthase [Magnetococcales bacterium]|nr:methionine synthase [Magnetococcales bacterium]